MKQVVLVTAPWCAACKPIKEYWPELKRDGITFEIWNADDLPPIYSNICSLPTLLFIDETGQEILRAEGSKPKQAVLATLDHLGW